MLFAENGNWRNCENFGEKEIGKKGILGENDVRKIGNWETVKRTSRYDKGE